MNNKIWIYTQKKNGDPEYCATSRFWPQKFKIKKPLNFKAELFRNWYSGTWNMFSKKTKQSHENGGCNASSYKWGTTNIAIFSQFHIFIHSSIFYKHHFNNMMMKPNLVHAEHVLAVHSCRMNNVHVICLILEKCE